MKNSAAWKSSAPMRLRGAGGGRLNHIGQAQVLLFKIVMFCPSGIFFFFKLVLTIFFW